MIYLDGAATMKPKYFAKDYEDFWLNSNTAYATREQKALAKAREDIKSCLGVKTGKALFCRCATEAVEWLKSYWENFVYNGHGIFVCSDYEHDSVFDLSYDTCKMDDYSLYNEDMYTHQYVNQLTGTVFDIESIGNRVKSTGAYFGSDFTAAIGHAPIPKNLDSFCDAVWFSGHKFGCEKGIGAIWISDELFKLFEGEADSKNQYGLLHGTVNVASALAMADAMKHAVNYEKSSCHYAQLLMKLQSTLAENEIAYRRAESEGEKHTCAINSIILPGINADALQMFLASNEIYVSIGASACAGKDKKYRALEKFGLTKKEIESTIRVSFSEDTTEADIVAFVEAIKKYKEIF